MRQVLNDLVVDRGPSPYLTNLELCCNDRPMTLVQGDGMSSMLLLSRVTLACSPDIALHYFLSCLFISVTMPHFPNCLRHHHSHTHRKHCLLVSSWSQYGTSQCSVHGGHAHLSPLPVVSLHCCTSWSRDFCECFKYVNCLPVLTVGALLIILLFSICLQVKSGWRESKFCLGCFWRAKQARDHAWRQVGLDLHTLHVGLPRQVGLWECSNFLHFCSVVVSTSPWPIPSINNTGHVTDWFDSLAECLNWNVRKKQKQLKCDKSCSEWLLLLLYTPAIVQKYMCHYCCIFCLILANLYLCDCH